MTWFCDTVLGPVGSRTKQDNNAQTITGSGDARPLIF